MGRARAAVARLVLLVGAVAFSLLALETGLRAYHGGGALGDWRNSFRATAPAADGGHDRFVRDQTLGFVLRPQYASAGENVDRAGFRIVPTPAPPTGRPVLVVGDSFAFGDDVPDDDAWPAKLQPLIGRPVLNAGVPAYGLDQTLLRLERLVPEWRPAAAILEFIADDVRRMEMSRNWGAGKPYFTLDGGELVLRNTPVPPDPPRYANAPLLHRLFGWSYLLAAVETRLVADRHEWTGDSVRALPRGSGEKMVYPLMARVARVGVPVLVVAQYEPLGWRSSAYGREQQRLSAQVLACARAAGLATLDLHAETDQAVRTAGYGALFYGYHLTARGNQVVADAVAAELRRLGWLDAP